MFSSPLTLPLHTQGDITDISIDPDNKYVASGSNDNVIRVWSLQDFSPLAVLLGHTDPVTSLTFSPAPFPDDRLLLSVSCDGTARLWSVNEMERQLLDPSLPPSETAVRVFRSSSRSKQIMCASFDATGYTLLKFFYFLSWRFFATRGGILIIFAFTKGAALLRAIAIIQLRCGR